jgi:hypothetical protein
MTRTIYDIFILLKIYLLRYVYVSVHLENFDTLDCHMRNLMSLLSFIYSGNLFYI